MANRSLEACLDVEKEGIDAEMIDLRCIKPLDTKKILESVGKTGKLLLVSEGCENANWINEIAMRVMEHSFDSLDAPIKRVCAADVPVPMSPVLEDAAIPNKERITNAIRELAG
jgi:pyruvate/2-oxoglutarate/acetoin dehydrogenase E1 component